MRAPASFAALLLGAACAGTGATGSSRSAPVVFAASSTTEVIRRIEPAATYNFAGSDELATQIEEGAHADVFVSAGGDHATELFRAGLIDEPVGFATNSIVLIVPRDNPGRIGSVRDLLEPGVNLVVAAAGVPIGDYTVSLLRALGAEAALDNVVSREQDAKGVVGKVAIGDADAGFVYATDVEPVAGEVARIELPKAAQPDVVYEIAIVRGSRHAAAARSFVDRVLSEDGRRALLDAGFGVP